MLQLIQELCKIKLREQEEISPISEKKILFFYFFFFFQSKKKK